MCACVCARCVHAYVRACVCARVRAYVRVCVCVCVRARERVRVRVRMFIISEKLNVDKEVYHGIRQTIWKVLHRQTQPTILYIAGVLFTKRPSDTSIVSVSLLFPL